MIKKTYINALIFFLIARSDFFWCIHITAPYKNLLSLIFYQTFFIDYIAFGWSLEIQYLLIRF